MISHTVRQKFLAYFASRGHEIFPSAPLITPHDPTLLFVNAGMNPFKEAFLGKTPPPHPRIASVQKCLRAGGKHNDLENVGKDTTHLTFFEMLGNFSFGDYGKKEAIDFAFHVAVEIFQFPLEKVWASVFTTDEEAWTHWKEYLPEERIVAMGEKDNFWSMGDTGPCGPCSELYYDRGEHVSQASSPLFDPEGARYVEFWNLVFMEQEKTETGTVMLPAKNIDTGAGLERVVALMEGKSSVFETDTLGALILEIGKLAARPYAPEEAAHFRIIADHVRALAFALADHASPSNTKEGYVLRKILRRAARAGKALGFRGPFLARLLPTLEECMGSSYPELSASKSRTESLITEEEELYLRTLEKGEELFKQARLRSTGKILSGEEAFKLKDTYGLPFEEILFLAEESGLRVDEPAFIAFEKKARALSKSQAPTEEKECLRKILSPFQGKCRFSYETTSLSSPLIGLIRKGEVASSLEKGEEGIVLLQYTPFYPEKGGQVGDTGYIHTKGGTFFVQDTQSPLEEVITHKGVVQKGTLFLHEIGEALVDEPMRRAIARHHSAVHLLQWALREHLGSAVAQQGSWVDATKFRFDFSSPRSLSQEDLFALEEKIQEKIGQNVPIATYEIPYKEAQKDPKILQFFADQYSHTVRVVDMQCSKELCGGTHACQTGDLQLILITKESAIGKGTRRIEGKASFAALNHLFEERRLLYKVQEKLHTSPHTLLEKLEKEQTEKEALRKTCRALEKKAREHLVEDLASKASGLPLTVAEIVSLEGKELSACADELAKRLPDGIILLGAKVGGRCQLIIRVSPQLSYNAKQLLQRITPLIEGGGGGSKTAAQAGGKKGEALPLALSELRTFLQGS
ncbi:MAG: alanine--tRNA ligase [Chlamydiota bacterium]